MLCATRMRNTNLRGTSGACCALHCTGTSETLVHLGACCTLHESPRYQWSMLCATLHWYLGDTGTPRSMLYATRISEVPVEHAVCYTALVPRRHWYTLEHAVRYTNLICRTLHSLRLYIVCVQHLDMPYVSRQTGSEYAWSTRTDHNAAVVENFVPEAGVQQVQHRMLRSCFSIRQHTSEYVRIRQHTSAYTYISPQLDLYMTRSI